jgi:hypothetical protein
MAVSGQPLVPMCVTSEHATPMVGQSFVIDAPVRFPRAWRSQPLCLGTPIPARRNTDRIESLLLRVKRRCGFGARSAMISMARN